MLATNVLPRAGISSAALCATPLLRPLPRQASSSSHAHKSRFSTSPRTMSLKSYLVTPSELHEALKTSSPTDPQSSATHRIIPVCASWFLPNDPERRTGHQVFSKDRIPHARFFDLDAVKDADSPYPHMLPTAEVFADAMSKLGLRRDDRVVVYDSAEQGLFSAPRVAWTLRVFGHERIHVLNNYRLWKQAGYPVETGPAPDAGNLETTKYPVPIFNSSRVIAFREVKDIAKRRKDGDQEKVQVVDVRSRGRFDGTSNEPRPGLSSGHMPGAINVPLSELLDSSTGAMLPAERLRAVFEARGVDPSKPIVSTCGTGVMAAACDMALELAEIGKEDERRVYDGSWTEYAQRIGKDEGLIAKEY